MKKIIKNSIKCNHCNDIIESKYRWDYKRCKCGKVPVDGGLDYLRRVSDPENWEELSECKG